MPRNYVRKTNSRRRQYAQDDVIKAIRKIEKGHSLNSVAKEYGIPKSTLHDRICGKSGQRGRPTALPKYDERMIASNMAALGDCGLAYTNTQIRTFVKEYLDANKREIELFNNNLPGKDWVEAFLWRQADILKNRNRVKKLEKKVFQEDRTNKSWPKKNLSTFAQTKLEDIIDTESALIGSTEDEYRLGENLTTFVGIQSEAEIEVKHEPIEYVDFEQSCGTEENQDQASMSCPETSASSKFPNITSLKSENDADGFLEADYQQIIGLDAFNVKTEEADLHSNFKSDAGSDEVLLTFNSENINIKHEPTEFDYIEDDLSYSTKEDQYQIRDNLESSDSECLSSEGEYYTESEYGTDYEPDSSSDEENTLDLETGLPKRRLRTKQARKRKRSSTPMAYSASMPNTSTIDITSPSSTPVSAARLTTLSVKEPAALLVGDPAADDLPAEHDFNLTPRSKNLRERAASSINNFGVYTLESAAGFRWSCKPQSTTRTRTDARNINFTPGPTIQAQDADTPEKCFNLLFDNVIIDEIVSCTNQEIQTAIAKYGKQITSTLSPTNPEEIRAFLGLLIFSGAQKDCHLASREMWCSTTGPAIYRATMSETRFTVLASCLRFDNEQTRVVRRKDDKFAPIRNIWSIFLNNCGKMYTPSKFLTIDEHLLAFRGRCSFKMYVPSKPEKYGIKLVLCNDNESKYLLGAIPYLGKPGTKPHAGLSLGHHFIKELTKPYHNTNRNVTTDHGFTSVPLVKDLLNCGTTLVGALKSNEKEVPTKLEELKDRLRASSAFLFTKEMTLVSYIPESSAKKMVLLLSSMHFQPKLGPKGKPEMIDFYNETKGGVDTFDKMCSLSSCRRKTKRWPLCIFYWMVNAAVINSWIILNKNMERTGGRRMLRREYMKELAFHFIKPHAQQRLGNPSLPKSLRETICDVVKAPPPATHDDIVVLAKNKYRRKRCELCPQKTNRLAGYKCPKCEKAMCLSHVYGVCINCA